MSDENRVTAVGGSADSASGLGATMHDTRLELLKKNFSPFKILSYCVVIVFSFLALYPLSRIFLRLFYNDGAIDFSPWIAVFRLPDIGQLLLNTIIVVAVSGVISLALGLTMAWCNERTDARVGIVTDALPLVPFLVPPIAGAAGWVLLLSDRGGLFNAFLRWLLSFVGIDLVEGPLNIYSWPGLIFVYVMYSVPYVYMLVSAGLRNVASDLEEQSRLSGSGLFRTMRKVTIPAVIPSLGASLLMLVWFGFALFSVPAVIGGGAGIEVLSVRMVSLLTFTYPPETATAVGLGLIIVLAVGSAWALQIRILRSGRHAVVGGKGHKISRIELGRWKWAARSLIFGYIFVAAVMPMIGLLLVAFNGFWTPNIQWTNLNFGSFREVLFEDGITIKAMRNSISLGIIGATIGITAAAILALFVQGSGKRVGRFVDGSIKFPASISSIVLAVGFTLAFSGAPFYLNGTFMILLLAYLALYLPQASVAADAAAAQVGSDLVEASRIAGAAGGRTFLRVSLPLMIAGLAAGWALLFVRMISDLTVSAILAGSNNPVVGFRILEIYESGSLASLAALSSLLTMVSMFVIIVLLVFTRKSRT